MACCLLSKQVSTQRRFGRSLEADPTATVFLGVGSQVPPSILRVSFSLWLQWRTGCVWFEFYRRVWKGPLLLPVPGRRAHSGVPNEGGSKPVLCVLAVFPLYETEVLTASDQNNNNRWALDVGYDSKRLAAISSRYLPLRRILVVLVERSPIWSPLSSAA